MSLIKNIEIDTLRLRALQVRDTLNNPISSGFQLFALGDGTTYWSSGITTQQFINLSTSVKNNQSSLNNIQSSLNNIEPALTIALDNVASTLTAEVFSSIYSLSSFIGLVENYSINTVYTDTVVAQYSTNLGITLVSQYQTISSASTFYGLGLQNTATAIGNVNQNLSSINASIVSTNVLIASNSTITTSTIFGKMSTYTGSTFNGILVIESTNFGVLDNLILANAAYTRNNINLISTNQGNADSTFQAIPSQLTSTLITLSTISYETLSTNYQSSINYTNEAKSTLWVSTLSLTSTVYASTQTALISTVSSIFNIRTASVSSILSTVYQISTQNGSTFEFFNTNISVLLSTGLTQNIYQTFIDLQAYSQNLIFSTTSTSNYIITSTNSALIEQNVSSYNGLLDSTFAYVNDNLYYSSLSTVIPSLESTINNDIIASNNYFNFVINSTTQYFTLLVNATYLAFSEDIITARNEAETQISTQVSEGLSTQNGVLSTSVSSFDGLITELLSINVNSLSSFTYGQYVTAPSIIVNRVDRLSTLSNTAPITGISSLVAGIIGLDTASYNNFYVLISDIGANVYYGLALTSTSQSKLNQDYTVQIDIKSTYTNNFYMLDTTNLSGYLGTPRIYNPKSYSINTNDTLTFPANTQEHVYLSTFVGAYIIDMKYTPMGMFIKNIQSYPYIYTTAVFTGPLIFPKNVQVANALLDQHSSFVYRNSPINISWQTNDLNIPLGVKFTGIDMYNRPMTKWIGPFPSANGSARISIPSPSAPLGRYDTIYLGVYPNNPRLNNTTDGNSSNPIFSTRTIPSSIYVVNPTINSYTRVLNPGTVNRYLQVTEVSINNDMQEKMTQVSTNAVFTIDTDSVNVNSFPYNGSYASFGFQNAFDNNLSTYFYGGYTASQINPNAAVGAQFSTTIGFQNLNPKTALVSSIDVYQGPLFSLQGMQLIYSNRNEPGISDGLFYSTINLVSSNVQSYVFG